MKMMIILITILDINSKLKGIIIICILSISLAILRKIPHIVTTNLQNIGKIQNQFLIILILMKVAESSEDLSDQWKMLINISFIFFMISRYIFLIFLLVKMIAFKFLKTDNKIMKIFRFSFFRKFFNGNKIINIFKKIYNF